MDIIFAVYGSWFFDAPFLTEQFNLGEISLKKDVIFNLACLGVWEKNMPGGNFTKTLQT